MRFVGACVYIVYTGALAKCRENIIVATFRVQMCRESVCLYVLVYEWGGGRFGDRLKVCRVCRRDISFVRKDFSLRLSCFRFVRGRSLLYSERRQDIMRCRDQIIDDRC